LKKKNIAAHFRDSGWLLHRRRRPSIACGRDGKQENNTQSSAIPDSDFGTLKNHRRIRQWH
jgi:hypothetical protein